MKPVVVKLGGSLAETGRLKRYLSLVCKAERPAVVVPGGGPYADTVRKTQSILGFSDAAAHDMAILSMNQMGHALISLEHRLVAAETLIGIRQALKTQRIPLWFPARLCARDQDIPRNWSITSDGLAARLAERLEADVVLVKSVTVTSAARAEALAKAQVIDAAFPAIVKRARLNWTIIGPGQESILAELLCIRRHTPKARAAGKRTQ